MEGIIRIEVCEKVYFGMKAIAYTSQNTLKYYPAFPWTFEIIDLDGEKHTFAGIPNMVETKSKALKRAWWRCKWLAEGTFKDKYKPIGN